MSSSRRGRLRAQRFPLADDNNAIYGAGFRWQPTERTRSTPSWEHRFFGASYNVTFDHRTPLSVWSADASRNITSYPQQLASLGGGVDVAASLNDAAVGRDSRPAQRAALVDQLHPRPRPAACPDRPGQRSTPQQITLQESLGATVGLLGARNTVFLDAYRLRSEPITGSGDSAPRHPATSLNEQHAERRQRRSGAPAHAAARAHGHRGRIANRWPTTSSPGSTNQGSIRASLITAAVAVARRCTRGVRYQVLRSDLEPTEDYNEAAVFVGVNHIVSLIATCTKPSTG